MSFSKSYGPVSISESEGVVSLQASFSESAGGGSAEGALKASAQVSLQLSVKQLLDASLSLAAEKYPAAAVEIGAVKALLDAAMAAV